MFDPPVTTIGTVIDAPKQGIYRVKLPNGKVVTGHIAKAMVHLHEEIVEGARVSLEMTPFDFEKARIVEVHPADEANGRACAQTD
ncbi:MAG: translation initiation factor IF-1 [Akkermansiaceae bacterium]